MTAKHDAFVLAFNEVAQEVHQTAIDKGWWEGPRNEAELIALIHSELSEGLEAVRKGLRSDHIPEYLGIEEELADVIIRLMDYANAFGYRVAEAVVDKMRYNEGREYRHGNKKY